MPTTTDLSVREVPTRKGSTEARFEKRTADILLTLGVWSYHTADKYLSGVPDRYCVGGNWIEFKVLPCSGKRSVRVMHLFSQEQKNFLTDLHERGDRAWAAIQFQLKNDDTYVVILPWHQLCSYNDKWTMEDVRVIGVKNNDLKTLVASRFGSQWERYSARLIYNV